MWINAEKGEQVRKESVIGVGPVNSVKVSSGKGDKLVEKTVYNFTLRLGTGGIIIKSPDYGSEEQAAEERRLILE